MTEQQLSPVEHRLKAAGIVLTSKGLQVQADGLGGCWQPRFNIAVGLHYVGELLAQHPLDLHAGVKAYNGSGPAADRYADHVLLLAAHFRVIIAGGV